MTKNHIVITLEEQDLLRLHEIAIDDDEREALLFLKEKVISQIPKKGNMPCDSTRKNPYLLK